MIRFEVPGPIRGKGRPRFVRATGRTFTPKPTEDYETWIKWNATEAMNGSGLLTGPLSLSIQAELEVPGSWSNKKRSRALAGELLPETKPDFDNLAKIVADACNRIVYGDDKQICVSLVTKRYAEKPRLVVEVEQLG